MATPMEVESEEEKYLSVWDELGKRLDNDMPPEDLQQRQTYSLMPPGDLQQAMQLLRDTLPSDFQTNLPSDVLQFLQNNNPQGRALSIMKHVLRIMNYHHHGKRTWSYEALFEEYEKKLKAFDKNETFVGRQEELNEILEMFSPCSKILGYWIHGRSGMGKTTLADEVCWNVRSRTAMKLIRLNLSETTNFTDMMMDFQREMGYYLSNESENNTVQDVLNLVQEIKQDTLILFDNIEEVTKHHEEELESFIPELIKRLKSSKFQIRTIFTSRSPLKILQTETLEALRSLHLHEFSRENAEKMLRLLSNTASTDDSQMEQILDNTELIPQKLALRHHALSLPPALFSNFSNQVDPDVLFAFRHLNDTKQKELAELMIFDTYSFDDKDAEAALNEDTNKVFQSLFDLINCHLIQESRQLANNGDTEWDKRSAYRIHPNVFSSLRKICEGQENEKLRRYRDEAFRRFSQTTLEKMERQCKDFEMFYEKAIRFAWQSSTRIKILFNFLSGNHLDMSYEQFNCLKCIPPLTFSFQRRYEIINKVAKAYKTKGNNTLHCFWLLEQAKTFLEVKEYKKANGILETLEKPDPPTKTQQAGEIIEKEGEINLFTKAQKADKIMEQVENSGLPELPLKCRTDAILKAEYFLTKGRTLRGLSKYKDAKEKQMQALKILEECAADDIPRQAAVCNAIGNILHDLEEYEESGRYHRKAVDIMREYVKEGPTLDMSVYLFNVGTISYAKADQMKSFNKERALELFMEALKYYTESIDFDIKWKLDSLNGHSDKLRIRARAYRELEQFDLAVQDAERSVELKEKLFPNGPWSTLILGYYQIGELYVKSRKTLFKRKGKEVQGSVQISGTADELLKKSWTWLNKAAHLIKEKEKDGLSPDDVESRCFAELYKEVAYSLSDRLGKDAEDFCSAFEAGEFMSGELGSSDEDSDENCDEKSSSSSHSDYDMSEPRRHDSGLADSDSDMDTEHAIDIQTVEQQPHSEDDRVFTERDDEIAPTSSSHKRKLSD